MSDDIDKLERAFGRQDKIVPRQNRRKIAIQAAMKQFEQENTEKSSNTRQGMGFTNRLKDQGSKMLHEVNRRLVMNIIRPNFKHVLAGGVSLGVLAIAIVNIDQIAPNLIQPSPTSPIVTDDKSGEKNAKIAKNEPVSQMAKTDEQKPLVSERLREDGASKITSNPPSTQTSSENDLAGLRKQEAEIAMLDSVTSSADQSAPAQPNIGSAELRVQNLAPSPVMRMANKPARLAKKSRQPQVVIRGFKQNSTSGNIVSNDPDRNSPGYYQDHGRDKFSDIVANPTKLVSEEPVSTFSVDVDTASYSFIRSSLNRGVLPQMDAVRVEELINYFNYNYKPPQTSDQPFGTNVSIMPTPWNAHNKLLRIGIKGYQLPKDHSKRANLVFLIDTSGSMNAPDKLPLLRNSFKLLLASLKPEDSVAIVTYAGSAGTVLAPTKVADKNKILSALDRLHSGGSTAGADGIHQAYQLAEQQLDKNGVNRVILATDGDFNVGITDPDELKNFVERKRKSGVTLSVLGFGHGNYNDQLMQALAQNGNGNAAYIDTLGEARKVLVEQAGATLFTIAKDVKLQLEFNPAAISEYRLIGYETRALKREDFNNDKVDAGDIGAGHSVTALYEITPVGASKRQVDELRYQKKKTQPAAEGIEIDDSASATTATTASEYAFMKIRYKLPNSNTSQLITSPITRKMEVSSISDAPINARFASAVAAFGQILRGGRNTAAFDYDDVIELALSAKGEDRFGYRAEFINLVRLAKTATALQPSKQ